MKTTEGNPRASDPAGNPQATRVSWRGRPAGTMRSRPAGPARLRAVALFAAAFVLSMLGGCSVQPDPVCPGNEVMVSNCAVCKLVWTAAGWTCVGPKEYAEAVASTRPASQPTTQGAKP